MLPQTVPISVQLHREWRAKCLDSFGSFTLQNRLLMLSSPAESLQLELLTVSKTTSALAGKLHFTFLSYIFFGVCSRCLLSITLLYYFHCLSPSLYFVCVRLFVLLCTSVSFSHCVKSLFAPPLPPFQIITSLMHC